MGATVSHALSMTSPNDPTYENQPQHWNSSHLFTLNAVGSELNNAFNNAGGVTFGLETNGSITAAAPAGAPSPVNFSAGTTSNNLASVVFSDSNGVGWGLNGSTITASYTQSTHAHTAWPLGFSAGTQTATSGTPGLANSNNFTFGMSGSSQITASFSESTHAHTAWPLGFSAGTQTATSGTPGLANSNNFTFGMSGSSQITASFSESTHAHTAWPLGFSAGTQTATSGTPGLANSNNFTFGMSGSSQITASFSESTHAHTAWPQAIQAGTQTATSGTVIFSNSNGISFGMSGTATITASYTVPTQTNQTVGFYALGTTTGQSSSSTWDARTLSFAGAGAISLGNSSNSGLIISSPVTSSIVGTSGLSVSSAGSTISVEPVPISYWEPVPNFTGTGTSSHQPASIWFSKVSAPWPVAMSYANVMKSMNVSAPGATSQASSGTNKISYSHGLTIFTRNGFGANSSQISQFTTASFGMTGTFSHTSTAQSVALSWVTNSTGGTTSFSTTSNAANWTNFFTGMQLFRIPLVTTLTPGEYFIGQQQSTTTATVGSNFTLLSLSNFHIAPQSNTVATITSSGSLAFSSPEGQGIGIASAVTTNNTMALSVISAVTQQWWYMNFSDA